MIQIRNEQIEELERIFEHTPQQIPKVIARAINRSAESARTQAGRTTRETYVVKHKDVISTMKIKKAYPSNLSAEIRSVGRPKSLTNFKYKANKPLPTRGKYAVVSVKKGNKKVITRSFVSKMGNGNVNVFTRVGKGRFPIRAHYGPSVPQMIGNDTVTRMVEERAMAVLDERLRHEIDFLLRG